jgi:hypothetical protein
MMSHFVYKYVLNWDNLIHSTTLFPITMFIDERMLFIYVGLFWKFQKKKASIKK